MNYRDVEIQETDTGYYLTWREHIDVHEYALHNVSIENIPDNSLGSARAVQRLLWEAMDGLGIHYSKHDDHKVRVIVVNQDGEEVE